MGVKLTVPYYDHVSAIMSIRTFEIPDVTVLYIINCTCCFPSHMKSALISTPSHKCF